MCKYIKLINPVNGLTKTDLNLKGYFISTYISEELPTSEEQMERQSYG